MSVDWSRYSTPEQTRARGRKPLECAVFALIAGEIRSIPTLDVLHTPLPDNQAHCDVPLPSDPEDLTYVRFKLNQIARIVLALPPATH